MGGARGAVAACFVASAMTFTTLTTGGAAVVSALPPSPGAGAAGGETALEPAVPDASGVTGTAQDLDAPPPARPPEGGPTNSELSRTSRSRSAETVVVEINHDGDRAAAEAAATHAGGQVHGPAGDLAIEATVPAGAVGAIEAAPHVTYVTTPTVAAPADVHPTAGSPEQVTPGAQVGLTNADDWHAVGLRGAGAKVGIIDTFDATTWYLSTLSGDLGGGPAGTFCRRAGTTCEVWSGRSVHGVAVAEIVHEMAPDAQIYLADAYTTADFQAAINYFHSQGVQIVTRSQTAEYDGPGNGTGGLASVIDDAVRKGMVYLNSAGNSGGSATRSGSYWRGTWTDADNDGWLEFASGDEMMTSLCWYFNGLRWNDWGSNRTDYDVVLYDTRTDPPTPLGDSVDSQRAGAPPIERFNNIRCAVGREVGIAVYRYHAGNGTAGDQLELMVNGAGLEHWSNPYAAAAPMVDSSNPGMLAIGAIDPPTGGTIASYSSHGPTNDGRTKPDMSAPSCVASTAYAPRCFNGTSASTPVVAGAAALALSAGLASTPAGLAAYMRSATQDRGAPGLDNVYGRGSLRLFAGTSAPFTSMGRLIERQYREFLGRPPTAGETLSWTRRFVLGSHVRADLVTSLRATTDNRVHVDPIVRLYLAAFQRVPDRSGLEYWTRRKRAGLSLTWISTYFAASTELTDRYGSLSDAQFVDRLYRNVLGRPADAAGMQFWRSELASGRRSRGRVLVEFSASGEFARRQSKTVEIAVVITQMMRRAPTPSEVSTLAAGPATAAVLAEYVFSRSDYPAS